MKCKRCEEELRKGNYYIKVDSLCKSCLVEEYMAELSVSKGNSESAMHAICDRYNLVFKRELLDSKRNEGLSLTAIFKRYMRDITSLPQYSRLDNRDSDIWTSETGNFEKTCAKEQNRTVADFLENERIQLQLKLDKALNNDDASLYGKYIQAYEKTLSLLEKTSWQEKFSHYHSDGKELISTWEQKGEDIRNEKVYEVKEVIKDNKILTKQYGESTDIIDSNSPMIFYYEKDKDLDIKNFKLSVKANESNQCNSFNDSHSAVKSSTSFLVKPSKYLLFSVNDGDLTRIEDGKLTKFDLSNFIKDGMNSIKIISNTQHRVTVSYECEGHISM